MPFAEVMVLNLLINPHSGINHGFLQRVLVLKVDVWVFEGLASNSLNFRYIFSCLMVYRIKQLEGT